MFCPNCGAEHPDSAHFCPACGTALREDAAQVRSAALSAAGLEPDIPTVELAPVDPDPERDAEEMRLSYENPNRFDDKRLFKFGGLEFNRPTVCDVVGFVVSFAICVGFVFVIVALAAYRPQ